MHFNEKGLAVGDLFVKEVYICICNSLLVENIQLLCLIDYASDL